MCVYIYIYIYITGNNSLCCPQGKQTNIINKQQKHNININKQETQHTEQKATETNIINNKHNQQK